MGIFISKLHFYTFIRHFSGILIRGFQSIQRAYRQFHQDIIRFFPICIDCQREHILEKSHIQTDISRFGRFPSQIIIGAVNRSDSLVHLTTECIVFLRQHGLVRIIFNRFTVVST